MLRENRFNLEFSGKIMPGRDRARARARFAEMFEVHSPARLEHYFSGETFVLRENLDRREGGEYYAKMRKVGLEAVLVKIDVEEPAPVQEEPASTPAAPPEKARKSKNAGTSRKQAAAQRKQKRKQAAAERRKKQLEKRLQQRAAEAEAQAQAADAANERARADAEPPRAPAAESPAATASPAITPRPAVTAAPGRRARVRSRLQLPTRRPIAEGQGLARRSGAPNPYRLKAFRNTAEVRNRADLGREQMRRGLTLGCAALALLLILAGSFLARQPAAPLAGPAAVAAASNGALVLAADGRLLLHDRAGVPQGSLKVSELDIADPAAPMFFLADGALLLSARAEHPASAKRQLWRCDLATKQCRALAGDFSGMATPAVVEHEISGDMMLVDPDLPGLLLLDRHGIRKGQSTHALPEHPVLRLDVGLLLMNSAEGPGISVFRIEDKSFGQQLDEILLLPPPAVALRQNRVWDFQRLGDDWWVTLYSPRSGSAGTYMFDNRWNYLRQVPRGDFPARARLVPWGRKMLLASDQSRKLLRFNAAGEPEADFTSPRLEKLIDARGQARRWFDLGWYAALLVALVAALVGFARAGVNYLRRRVYRKHTAHGAEPLDAEMERIEWLTNDLERGAQLRRTTVSYALFAGGVCAIALGLGASGIQLLALLIALSGPAFALWLLKRSAPDHVGLLGKSVVLVDHRETYHRASGRALHRRGPFLFIDDVIVFLGSRALPALDPATTMKYLEPSLSGCTRADRAEVAVRLRESGHPLARAALAVVAALLFALLLLAVGHLPW